LAVANKRKQEAQRPPSLRPKIIFYILFFSTYTINISKMTCLPYNNDIKDAQDTELNQARLLLFVLSTYSLISIALT
jgi:hypothetical protein